MNQNKKETVISAKIPKKLVEILRLSLNAKSDSDAIRLGITYFLSSPSYPKKMDDNAIHQLLSDPDERDEQKNYSFRVLTLMKDRIDSFKSTINTEFNEDMYNVITLMLAHYLYFSKQATAKKQTSLETF